jgi:hypothetical protein
MWLVTMRPSATRDSRLIGNTQPPVTLWRSPIPNGPIAAIKYPKDWAMVESAVVSAVERPLRLIITKTSGKMPNPNPNRTAGITANDVGSHTMAAMANRVELLAVYKAGRSIPGREPKARRIMPDATETSCMTPNCTPLSEALRPWDVNMYANQLMTA